MDDQSRLRQLYLRFVLSIGIVWGLIPLIMLPFTFRGSDDSTFNTLSVVLNSLTVLPSSVLAFWHRRVACVWLTINAILLVSSLSSWLLRTHDYQIGAIIGCGGSVLLAIYLDVAEARRWPTALDRGGNDGARTQT